MPPRPVAEKLIPLAARVIAGVTYIHAYMPLDGITILARKTATADGFTFDYANIVTAADQLAAQNAPDTLPYVHGSNLNTNLSVLFGQIIVGPTGANVVASQGAPSTNTNAWPTKITDGVNTVTVFQGHNTDNLALGSAGYAINTAGVAQILNPIGNTDRQRGTGIDGVPAVGIASGTQQLASPFATTSATPALTAGPNKVITPASMAGIQVGSVLVVDGGAAQETVSVTAVTATTFTTVLTKAHDGSVTPFAVKGFVYNQGRDATNPEGSGGAGIALGGTLLFNSALNGGTGGWENERSALGENDGASGKGTAVAAEYEFNGGGPVLASGLASGFAYDRARSVNAKGMSSMPITATVAGNASLVFASAAATNLLLPGQAVQLTGGAVIETVYPTNAWVPGSAATVPLVAPVVNAGQTSARWDSYSANGPGLNGFTPFGVGIEEEALYDPISGLFYLERSATADAMPPQNVVAESGAVWNGTAFDRMRAATGEGMPTTGIAAEAAMIWNGTSFDRLREATGDALPATGIAAEAPALWNGTSFDRAPGDKTTGAFVNVKALPPLPTGANAIGTVGVTALPALPPGTNAIGTVGVTALPALPAGANAIGSVSVSNLPATQAVSGTVAVSTLPSLPTGTNAIGTVAVTGTTTVTGNVALPVGSIFAATVTAGGTAYTSAPTVALSGGGGSGATIAATIGTSTITSATLTAGGSAYTTAPTVTLSGGGGSGATITAAIGTSTIASATVTAGGSGYTSAPAVSFTGGGGTGATATAALAPAGVGTVAVATGGAGYTTAPTVSFTGGGGSGATATATIASGAVTGFTLTAPGSGYTSAPAVVLTGGGFTTAATATATLAPAAVASVTVTAPGSGYTSAPTLAFGGGGGSGATGTATISGAPVTSVAITAPGSGYTSAPTVVFAGGGGSGAAATTTISGAPVTALSVTTPGSGYSSPPTLTLSGGGGSGATGTAAVPTPVAAVALATGTNAIGTVSITGTATVATPAAATTLNQASAAQTTSGASASLNTASLSALAVDVNVSAVAGTSPALNLFVDRLGADAIWYPVWSSATIAAVGVTSTSIGAGLSVAAALTTAARLRWTITGTTPSFTFSASIVGR
ncbi:MAG: hypothetical protein NVSMB30_05340 [Hymenobacter sp.]